MKIVLQMSGAVSNLFSTLPSQNLISLASAFLVRQLPFQYYQTRCLGTLIKPILFFWYQYERTSYFAPNYFSGVELNTFFILVVLSSLLSIFSALLEDSLFYRYFSRFWVSAQHPRGLFILAVLFLLPSICAPPSRTLGGLFILAVLFPLPNICSPLLEDSLF